MHSTILGQASHYSQGFSFNFLWITGIIMAISINAVIFAMQQDIFSAVVIGASIHSVFHSRQGPLLIQDLTVIKKNPWEQKSSTSNLVVLSGAFSGPIIVLNLRFSSDRRESTLLSHHGTLVMLTPRVWNVFSAYAIYLCYLLYLILFQGIGIHFIDYCSTSTLFVQRWQFHDSYIISISDLQCKLDTKKTGVMVQANMLGALDEYLLFLFLFLCCVELKPPIPMSTIGVATICGKDVPKLFIMDEKGYTKSTAYIEGLAKFAYNDHLDLFTIPLLGIFEHPTKLFPKDDFFLCQRLNMLLFLFFITMFLRGF